MRHHRLLLASLLALVLSAGLVTVAASPPSDAQAAQRGVTIAGLDLHDGIVIKDGATYRYYGTQYGCGFQWQVASPWCGFGVSSAPSLDGPWSPPTRLFSPSDRSPFNGRTWQQICGDSGAGCFNPRMVQRSGWGANDGVWILWFNAPDDYNRTRSNAYYAMGCNGPTGPCGAVAGPPYGSTVKPSLYRCHDNGDFSIVPDPPRNPMILCTMADQTLNSERLTEWGTGGVQGTGRTRLAGMGATESPGAYRDARTGRWILTFNEPNCGYCGGTGTSYATSSAIDGAFTSPGNPGFAAPASGRRLISGHSCGGQGRTVTVLDGVAFQVIDTWDGGRNQTGADTRLEPLVYRGETPPGQPLQPFAPWTCG